MTAVLVLRCWREVKVRDVDPVCKMPVDPRTAEENVTYQGKVYYFCSQPCADQFQANPGKFVNAA
jgi:YHS domain-containing protein